jgi:cytochrome c oxidase cbb3-type subunit 1
MEQVLLRAGLWFGALVLAVVACALAVDQGFAIHMVIFGIAAALALWVTISGKNVDDAVRGILRMPDQGRYDDDVIAGASSPRFSGVSPALPLACGSRWS